MSAGYDGREAENDFRTYVAQYRQHLEDIRAHLAGGRSLGDHEEADATDHVDEPEVPARPGEQDGAADESFDLFFPLDVAEEPAEDENTWTASEQDAFFHGLAVYSRLRPNLIASCIPTKTVPDVCAYLEALEEAASHHPLPDALDRRRTAPLAMEVSDSWLEWEETQATRLAAAEPDWEAYALNAQRQDTLATYPPDTSDPALETLQAHWKAEDALRTLDTHKLRAISHILRVDEAAEDDPSRPVTPNPITPNPTTLNPTAPNPLDEDGAETAALGRSQSPSRPRSHSSTPSTRDLSPKSRRLLQKRLYMRRKRAEKAGTEAVQDAGLLKVGRPKKARPPRKRRRRGRGEDQEGAADSEDQDQDEREDADADGGEGSGQEDGEGEEGKEDEDYAHPHRGGTTAPYKARRLFEEAGITPAVLAEYRHDLFDGIGVARWLDAMRDDPDLEDDAIPPNAVSGPLLATLRDIVVDFVTDVAHRAIVSREQEVQFKAASKAWRVKNPGVVLTKNVEHALEMMGMAVPERPKKRKRPSDEDYEDEDAQEQGEEPEDENRGDASDAEEDEVSNASRPSSQRANGSSSQSANGPSSHDASVPELDSPYDLVDDLYPSFFRLPRAYEGNNDDLMPEDTDEEALERVLDDEEELDAQDLVVEGEYEDELWTSVTGDPS
ncbi:hypothetical protein FB107DRAFT_271011 [Schizophyllum commune]